MKLKHLLIAILAGCFLLFSAQSEAQKSNILIEKGLAYLASVQSTTKGYEPGFGPSIDPDLQNIPSKTPGDWNGAGISALCLQAFLQNGHNIDDPLYGAVVTNGINYLLGKQTLTGSDAGKIGTWSQGYETAMSIEALNLALNTPLAGGGYISGTLSTDIQDAIDLAINYYMQDVIEGWTAVSWRYSRGYTSEYNGDMSINQWVYLALDAVDYTDKDIWNKIYQYLNNKKCTSGNASRVGYTSCGTRAQGMTCAGAWGAVLAGSHGVAAAPALKTEFINYLKSFSINQLIDPAYIGSNQIYIGGGYYYYLYGFAKAMSLSNETIINGTDWYTYMYNKIEGQHLTDGNGNYYWNQWGGEGTDMETALALLCLQTQAVPQGSTLKVSFETPPAKDDCLEFVIYDELGNAAGQVDDVWYTNIPNSEWISNTGGYYELSIEVEEAGNYNAEMINTCAEPMSGELCYRSYVEDVLTDEECFLIEDMPYLVPIGATGFVNAIGGLNIIIVVPPVELPVMQISPNVYGIHPFEYNQTYNFSFDINETGGGSPMVELNIFASDLTDEFGNVIPAANFTFTPAYIEAIVPGGSETVQVSFTTPATLPLDPGLFQGNITVQSAQQAKGINFEIGKPTMSIDPENAYVPFEAGTTTFAIDFTGLIGSDWDLLEDADWLTASPLMGSNDHVVTINYDANNSGMERTAEITISAPGALNPTVVFTLTQATTPFPYFIVADLEASEDQITWWNVEGTLGGGYTLNIDENMPGYALTLGDETETNVPLAEDMFPFYLDTDMLPADFYTYWAARGVIEGSSGWQGIMWEIINGNEPTFYIKASNAKDQNFMLVDGLQFLVGNGELYLTIPGDYPLGAYTYTGYVMDDFMVSSEMVSVIITFVSDFVQEIDLQAGWLGISSYLIPNEPPLETVLADIEDDMVIMLAKNGLYWPAYNANTIGDWNTYTGYKIKISNPTILEITGSPANTTLEIPAGFHYMPVLSSTPIDNELFADMGDALLYAFNLQDQLVYWPKGELYTLQELEPGIGYLINLFEPVTVDFSMYKSSASQSIKPIQNNSIWADVVNTGNAHLISIQSKALDALQPGDYVGAFDQEGNIAGLSAYQSGIENLQLIVFGDDIYTDAKDGLADGERMDLRVYKANENAVYQIDAAFDAQFNTGIFESNATSIISGLKLSPLGFGEGLAAGFNIYPNPSNGLLNLQTNASWQIEIVNAAGQVVHNFAANGNTKVDISNLEKGVYFLKASNDSERIVEKLIVK